MNVFLTSLPTALEEANDACLMISRRERAAKSPMSISRMSWGDERLNLMTKDEAHHFKPC